MPIPTRAIGPPGKKVKLPVAVVMFAPRAITNIPAIASAIVTMNCLNCFAVTSCCISFLLYDLGPVLVEEPLETRLKAAAQGLVDGLVQEFCDQAARHAAEALLEDLEPREHPLEAQPFEGEPDSPRRHTGKKCGEHAGERDGLVVHHARGDVAGRAERA